MRFTKFKPEPSMLAASAGGRVAVVAAALAVLWLGVLWAVWLP